MYNADEARKIIEKKMKRFAGWSVYSISEDDDNYYFFFGAKICTKPDPEMPILRFNKCTGKVDILNIFKGNNFKTLCAARVFYHRDKKVNLSVEERAAIRRKYKEPDSLVLCPRCGKKIQYIKEHTSIFVQCETMYCIYCSTRVW